MNRVTDQSETAAGQFFDQKVEEWVERYSSPDDFWYRSNTLGSNFLAKYLPSQAACLEIGCAAGQFSELLHRQGHLVFGVDIAPGMIEAARRRLGHLGVSEGNFQCYDGHFLPFDDSTFDLVTALSVLPYIENQPDYIREVHRVLKPGGLAFCNNVNRGSLHMMILLIKLFPHAFGGTYLVHRSWFVGMYKALRHGYSSGGFVDLSKAIQARSAKMLDRFFVDADFNVVGSYDMYNLRRLDQNPLDRKRFSAWAARRWAWNHFGLYKKNI